MTKLARLIGQEEGFGIPGAIPTTHHNPGDLEHSPHSAHVAGDPVGRIDTDADGWADLERQLQIFADHGMTLRAAIYTYAPPEQNNSEQYLTFICDGLGCSPDTLVSEALKQP